jgi:hypothetical protein
MGTDGWSRRAGEVMEQGTYTGSFIIMEAVRRRWLV